MNPIRHVVRLGPALAVAALALCAGRAPAQAKKPPTADRIDFQVTVTPPDANDPFAPQNVVKLTITGTPRMGYYTYPITKRTPDQPELQLSSIKYTDVPAGLKPVWPVTESEPEFKAVEGIGVFLVHTQKFTWSQDVFILPDATPGTKVLRFKVRVQVCKDDCVWGEHELQAEINVTPEQAGTPLTARQQKRLLARPEIEEVSVPAEFLLKVGPLAAVNVAPDRGGPKPANGGTPPGGVQTPTESPRGKEKFLPVADTPEEHKAGLDRVLEQLRGEVTGFGGGSTASLLTFMLAGAFWGFVSLITPCVFPMIPITVSYFLKQSEKENHRPVAMALVYTTTIVVVLTVAAVLLLSFFRWLSVNPIMNFAIGALFVYFALSLFGMYEIELPSFLTRYTTAKQGQGGMVGTVFMALTFTIVSFACVAPFLGGFGGTASGSGITLLHRVLGGLAFAATFASPFFVLALFPNLLKRMPKSGSWLNSVKVVMGFLELAAALKFFRAGELVLIPEATVFTFDLVLGMWVALALLCALYLINVFRLPHDSPAENIGVPRFLFGFAFLSLALYLAPALLKITDGENARPHGSVYAWVDSFLLPEPSQGRGDLNWSGNLALAVADAREQARKTGQRQFLFVDFTGETCTNCKLNERNVFSKPEVKELFRPYRLVQMYTDKVPDKLFSDALRSRFGQDTSRQRADAAANLDFQKAAFNTEELPLYVVLEPRPDGTIAVIDQYKKGLIRDVAEFAQFLKAPLAPGAQALR